MTRLERARARSQARRLRDMVERINLAHPLGPGFHAELLDLARDNEKDVGELTNE